MVSFTTLATTLLAASSTAVVVSAQFLGVVETQFQAWNGGTNGGCSNTAPLFEIYAWDNGHQGDTGCSFHGRSVARSNRKNGSQMEGCHGGYTNGWSVCVTSYGGNVHNGRGQHQRCHTDLQTLLWCPTPICINRKVRKLRCDGVWHNDA